MTKKKPSIHVIACPRGGWSVKKEGNTKATSVYKTKEGAVNRASTLRKKTGSEVIVHKKDGTIQQRSSKKTASQTPKQQPKKR